MILGDKATLEAKGADAAREGGGGGGGLISITYGEGFVGKEPVANESTKGGEYLKDSNAAAHSVDTGIS